MSFHLISQLAYATISQTNELFNMQLIFTQTKNIYLNSDIEYVILNSNKL